MQRIMVNERYQTGYEYTRAEKVGQNFHPDFKPELTPAQMLALGIFGGNYFTEIPHEFPAAWFAKARLSDRGTADKQLNYFKINASQPLKVWQAKGWIYPEDPKGWFLWYCRYYYGRRIVDDDVRQIKRWQHMRRHTAQIKKYCTPGDLSCRPRQRQALLHWAYDSRII